MCNVLLCFATSTNACRYAWIQNKLPGVVLGGVWDKREVVDSRYSQPILELYRADMINKGVGWSLPAVPLPDLWWCFMMAGACQWYVLYGNAKTIVGQLRFQRPSLTNQTTIHEPIFFSGQESNVHTDEPGHSLVTVEHSKNSKKLTDAHYSNCSSVNVTLSVPSCLVKKYISQQWHAVVLDSAQHFDSCPRYQYLCQEVAH